MNSRRIRHVCCVGAPVVAGLVVAATLTSPASAAPASTKLASGWSYSQTSIPAGVADGAELAIDQKRRKIFVTDADDFNYKDPKSGQVLPYPHPLNPKVAVLSADSRKVLRSISYNNLPTTTVPVSKTIPAKMPMKQIPVGIALDTRAGRVLTTNAETNAATIVSMNARAATPGDMVKSKLDHPMGIAADPTTGRAYIANVTLDEVAVIDTATRREITRIKDIYSPSFIAIDSTRHRVYIGNADIKTKGKTNYLTVVDSRTNTIVKKITTAANSRPAVDAATGKVYAASFATGEVAVIDPDSLTIVARIQTGATPNKIAIDSKRRVAYTSNLFKKTFTVIDLKTNAVVGAIPAGVGVHTLAVDERTGTVFSTQFQSSNLTVLSVKRG